MRYVIYYLFTLSFCLSCKSGTSDTLDEPTKLMKDTIVAKDGFLDKETEFDTLKISSDSTRLEE